MVVSASLVSHTWSKQCLNKKNISFLIISGLLGYVLGTITFIWALELETVIYLAPFVSLTIPFGFIFSVSIIRERRTKKSTFGTMLFFSGVILAAL
ncbi:MAG: EamA family transporter [Candidatus Hadarchaeaceae archaeon]